MQKDIKFGCLETSGAPGEVKKNGRPERSFAFAANAPMNIVDPKGNAVPVTVGAAHGGKKAKNKRRTVAVAMPPADAFAATSVNPPQFGSITAAMENMQPTPSNGAPAPRKDFIPERVLAVPAQQLPAGDRHLAARSVSDNRALQGDAPMQPKNEYRGPSHETVQGDYHHHQSYSQHQSQNQNNGHHNQNQNHNHNHSQNQHQPQTVASLANNSSYGGSAKKNMPRHGHGAMNQGGVHHRDSNRPLHASNGTSQPQSTSSGPGMRENRRHMDQHLGSYDSLQQRQHPQNFIQQPIFPTMPQFSPAYPQNTGYPMAPNDVSLPVHMGPTALIQGQNLLPHSGYASNLHHIVVNAAAPMALDHGIAHRGYPLAMPMGSDLGAEASGAFQIATGTQIAQMRPYMVNNPIYSMPGQMHNPGFYASQHADLGVRHISTDLKYQRQAPQESGSSISTTSSFGEEKKQISISIRREPFGEQIELSDLARKAPPAPVINHMAKHDIDSQKPRVIPVEKTRAVAQTPIIVTGDYSGAKIHITREPSSATKQQPPPVQAAGVIAVPVKQQQPSGEMEAAPAESANEFQYSEVGILAPIENQFVDPEIRMHQDFQQNESNDVLSSDTTYTATIANEDQMPEEANQVSFGGQSSFTEHSGDATYINETIGMESLENTDLVGIENSSDYQTLGDYQITNESTNIEDLVLADCSQPPGMEKPTCYGEALLKPEEKMIIRQRQSSPPPRITQLEREAAESVATEAVEAAAAVASVTAISQGPIRYSISELRGLSSKGLPPPAGAALALFRGGQRKEGSGDGNRRAARTDSGRPPRNYPQSGPVASGSYKFDKFEHISAAPDIGTFGGHNALREISNFNVRGSRDAGSERTPVRFGRGDRRNDRQGGFGGDGSSGSARPVENSLIASMKPRIDTTDPEQVYLREVHLATISNLNKICPENFEKLSEYFVQTFKYPSALSRIADIIVSKSFDEPKFAHLYAQLTQKIVALAKGLPVAGLTEAEANLQIRRDVRNLIVASCEKHFTSRPSWSQIQVANMTDADFEDQLRIKNKALGNMRYVGNLYNYDCISDRALQHILDKLVFENIEPLRREENLECAVLLLTIAGPRYEERLPPTLSTRLFGELQNLVRLETITPRLKYLIMDVVALRENRWHKPTGRAIQDQMSREQNIATLQKQPGAAERAKKDEIEGWKQHTSAHKSARPTRQHFQRQAGPVAPAQPIQQAKSAAGNSFSLLRETDENQAHAQHEEGADTDTTGAEDLSSTDYLAAAQAGDSHYATATRDGDAENADEFEYEQLSQENIKAVKSAFSSIRSHRSEEELRAKLDKLFRISETDYAPAIMRLVLDGLTELRVTQAPIVVKVFEALLGTTEVDGVKSGPALTADRLVAAVSGNDIPYIVMDLKLEAPMYLELLGNVVQALTEKNLLNQEHVGALRKAFCLTKV